VNDASDVGGEVAGTLDGACAAQVPPWECRKEEMHAWTGAGGTRDPLVLLRRVVGWQALLEHWSYIPADDRAEVALRLAAVGLKQELVRACEQGGRERDCTSGSREL
jgi:hypothetical protein